MCLKTPKQKQDDKSNNELEKEIFINLFCSA